MAEYFWEECVTDFSNISSLELCVGSLEDALKDYDRFIYACTVLNSGEKEEIKLIQQWHPGFDTEIATHWASMKKKQEYDRFCIENFYKYCKIDPEDPVSGNKYAFCEYGRNGEIDKIIQRQWLSGHVP